MIYVLRVYCTLYMYSAASSFQTKKNMNWMVYWVPWSTHTRMCKCYFRTRKCEKDSQSTLVMQQELFYLKKKVVCRIVQHFMPSIMSYATHKNAIIHLLYTTDSITHRKKTHTRTVDYFFRSFSVVAVLLVVHRFRDISMQCFTMSWTDFDFFVEKKNIVVVFSLCN